MIDTFVTAVIVIGCLIYVAKIGYGYFKGKNSHCGCSCNGVCPSSSPVQSCDDIKPATKPGDSNG